MGSDATGILAYGYDLGVISSHFDLAYDDDGNETGGPAWMNPDVYEQEDNASRALLVAAGFTNEQYDTASMAEQAAMDKAVGVEIIRHGGVEGDEILILAAVVHTADWGDTTPIRHSDLYPPAGADERLSWALGVLGITPESDGPSWLLAAHYS